MGDKDPIALDQLVECPQSTAICRHCEIWHPPDHLPQQIHDGSNIEDLDSQSCALYIDNLKSCLLGGNHLIIRVTSSTRFGLRTEKELDQLEDARRPDMLGEVDSAGTQDSGNLG